MGAAMSDLTDHPKRRFETEKVRATDLYTSARRDHVSVAFGEELYHVDRDAHGSVLGSAVALRMFLFSVPATVTLVGLVNLFGLSGAVDEQLEASATTGAIANSVIGSSTSHSLWLVVSGLFFTLWAGKSLARTLAESSGAAWGMPASQSKYRIITILAVSGVFIAGIITSAVFNQLREAGGALVGVVSLGTMLGLNALFWFVVMLTLPRPVSDPGALLPGALLFAVGNTILQWFMHYYLPDKIARTAEKFGEFATTVAILGNYFFVGRLMTAGFALASVTYARWGSLSALVFRIPGLSAAARRSPKLRDFFSLELVDKGAKKPAIESVRSPDPLLGGTDEDLRRHGDQGHVEQDL